MKKKEIILEISPKQMHQRLMENVIEDTRESAVQFRDRGVFMGKVGAKKFYILYKPAKTDRLRFCNIMRADICDSENENECRIRYSFSHFSGSISQKRLVDFLNKLVL